MIQMSGSFRERNGKHSFAMTTHLRKRFELGGFTQKRHMMGVYSLCQMLKDLRLSGLPATDELRDRVNNLQPNHRKKIIEHGLLANQKVNESLPIWDHIDAWEEDVSLKTKHNNGREQAQRVRNLICHILVMNNKLLHKDPFSVNLKKDPKTNKYKDSLVLFYYDDIVSTDIEKALAIIKIKPYRQKPRRPRHNSIQKYKIAIKSFANWMESNGRAAKKPDGLDKIKIEQTTSKQRSRNGRRLTDGEIKRLYNAPEPWKWFFIFAINTGVRKESILNLEIDDVDLDNRVFRIVEKSGDEVYKPLNDQAYSVAEHLVNNPQGKDGRLFKYYSKTAVLLRKYAKSQDLVFHCLRHTYCTIAMEQGANMKEIQEMLGQKTAGLAFKVYAHAQSDNIKALNKKVAAVLPDVMFGGMMNELESSESFMEMPSSGTEQPAQEIDSLVSGKSQGTI